MMNFREKLQERVEMLEEVLQKVKELKQKLEEEKPYRSKKEYEEMLGALEGVEKEAVQALSAAKRKLLELDL